MAVHAFTDDGQLILRQTAGIPLTVPLTVTAHSDRQVFGKRVDAGNAHAVQAAGNLVACIVKLAAGMQLCHDHLNGGYAFLGVDINGNAAAIVTHGNAVVGMQNDGDARAKARHGLVNGVIHHFVNKMVQAARVR